MAAHDSSVRAFLRISESIRAVVSRYVSEPRQPDEPSVEGDSRDRIDKLLR